MNRFKYYVSKLSVIVLIAVTSFTIESCNKSDNSPEQTKSIVEDDNQLVTLRVAYEIPRSSSDTKVQINETTDNFFLSWVGSESLYLTTSTSNSYSAFTFEDIDSDGVATFTGTVPSAGTATTTNYLATLKDVFYSVSATHLRGEIKQAQEYLPTNNARYSFLVARQDDVPVGDLSQPLQFKTMNSFLKVSLLKGSAAAGSTNVYDKMYVHSIELESLGGEPLAGKFGISKSNPDYFSSYGEVVDGKSTITLMCATSQYPHGVELDSNPQDFYFTVAFGNFSNGIKVTIHVQNSAGDCGILEKTIGASSGKTFERNKLYATPNLTVNPTDNNDAIKYELIDNPSDITSGDYYISGVLSPSYHLWTGTLNSGDMVTSVYTYSGSSQLLSGSGAAKITLTENGDDTYSITNSKGEYMYVTSYESNRKIGFTASSGSAAKATFTVNSKGGMTLQLASGSKVGYVVTNGASNVIREYTNSTTGTYGIVLFKRVGSGGGGSGGGGGGDPSDPTDYGYLELPEIPASLGNNKLYTLYATMNGVSGVRNYTALYNPDYYAQMWTAYPLHPSHSGSLKRPGSWTENPLISKALQTVLTKSYGGKISTPNYSDNLYSRGHQIPNGDRNGVYEMQLQTFYWTNSTPQLQNGFNGSIWGQLEEQIRSVTKSFNDTVYIVTGPVYQTVGGSETINYWTNVNDGKSIAIPNYYYKIVLKVRRTGGVITSARAIGFWFEHKDYGNNKNFQSYAKSVTEIETLTGYSFYKALPESVAATAKSNSSWSSFTSF